MESVTDLVLIVESVVDMVVTAKLMSVFLAVIIILGAEQTWC